MIGASSFALTVSSLLQSQQALPHISGFASLNYRLSTPPPLPQFAEFRPRQLDDPARNVKHPAHLNDVEAALIYLQRKYGFGSNYVLIGHSCGATLAFQLQSKKEGVMGPKGILGVEGIYDLKKLRDDYKTIPMYQYFTESAFGKDEEDWKKASPTTQKNEGGFVWEKAQVMAIAQSRDDELVNVVQRDLMWDVVKKCVSGGRRNEKIEMVGKHDEVWKVAREDEEGTQLSVATKRVLELLAEG
jgi:kynurenine formamidase